jgi:hypothetical protein
MAGKFPGHFRFCKQARIIACILYRPAQADFFFCPFDGNKFRSSRASGAPGAENSLAVAPGFPVQE